MSHHVESFEELLEELRELTREAGRLVAETSGERSREVREALQARLKRAEQRVAEIGGRMKRNVTDQARRADANVHENPYRFLAVAAVAGVLLGMVSGGCCRASSAGKVDGPAGE